MRDAAKGSAAQRSQRTDERSDPTRPEKLVSQASRLLLRAQTEDAINLLRKGTANNPFDGRVAFLLAQSLVASERLDEGKQLLQKIVSTAPSADAYQLLIDVCLAKEEGVDALAYAQESLQHFPDQTRLRERLHIAQRKVVELDGDGAEWIDADLEEDDEDDPTLADLTAQHTLAPTDPQRLVTLPPQQFHSAASHFLGDGPADAPNLVAAIERFIAAAPPTAPRAQNQAWTGTAPQATTQLSDGLRTPADLTAPNSPLALKRQQQKIASPMLSVRHRSNTASEPQILQQATAVMNPLKPLPSVADTAVLAYKNIAAGKIKDPTVDDETTTKKPAAAITTRQAVPRMPSLRGDSGAVVNDVAIPDTAPDNPALNYVRRTQMVSPLSSLQIKTETTRRLPWYRKMAWIGLTVAIAATAYVGTNEWIQRREQSQTLRFARQLRDQLTLNALHGAKRRLAQVEDQELALSASVHAALYALYGDSNPELAQKFLTTMPRTEDAVVAQEFLNYASGIAVQNPHQLWRYADQWPHNYSLNWLAGYVALTRREFTTANKFVSRLPAQHQAALLLRAELAQRNGDTVAAQHHLSRAVALGLSAAQATLVRLRWTLDDPHGVLPSVSELKKILTADSQASAQHRSWARLILAISAQRSGVAPEQAAALLKRAVDGEVSHSPATVVVVSPEFHLKAAEAAYELSMNDLAERELALARRFWPNDPQVVMLQAHLDLVFDRAATALQRLAPLSQDNAGVQLLTAEIHLRRGELNQARLLLNRLTNTPVDQSAVALLWASVEIAEGSPQNALQTLAKMGQLEGKRAREVQLITAQAKLALGEMSEAEKLFRGVLANEPQQQMDALLGLAQLALRRGDGFNARQMLEKAVATNPHWLKVRIELGRLFHDLGQYAAAREQFAEVIRRDPQNLFALVGRARASVEIDSEETEADLLALRSSGHDNMASLLTARHMMRRGQWQSAALEFSHLDTQWLNGEPDARLWLSMVYRRLGQWQRAQVGLKQLTLVPKVRAAALLELSRISSDAARWRDAQRFALQAEQAARRSLASTTVWVEIYMQQGMLAEAQKQPKLAEQSYQRALKRCANCADVHVALAKLALKTREYEKAVNHLTSAITLEPNNATAVAMRRRSCDALRATPIAGCKNDAI